MILYDFGWKPSSLKPSTTPLGAVASETKMSKSCTCFAGANHIQKKKPVFFLPRDLHEYLEFFDQIFFKPQVKLEIYRFRMFLNIIWLVEIYFIDPKLEGPDIFR